MSNYHKLKYHPVFRYDEVQGIFRLFRFTWANGKNPNKKGWCSYKLSLAISKKMFIYKKDRYDVFVIVLFIRFHLHRSYGGWCV